MCFHANHKVRPLSRGLCAAKYYSIVTLRSPSMTIQGNSAINPTTLLIEYVCFFFCITKKTYGGLMTSHSIHIGLLSLRRYSNDKTSSALAYKTYIPHYYLWEFVGSCQVQWESCGKLLSQGHTRLITLNGWQRERWFNFFPRYRLPHLGIPLCCDIMSSAVPMWIAANVYRSLLKADKAHKSDSSKIVLPSLMDG